MNSFVNDRSSSEVTAVGLVQSMQCESIIIAPMSRFSSYERDVMWRLFAKLYVTVKKEKKLAHHWAEMVMIGWIRDVKVIDGF